MSEIKERIDYVKMVLPTEEGNDTMKLYNEFIHHNINQNK